MGQGNKDIITKLELDIRDLYNKCNTNELKQQETTVNFKHMVEKIDEFLQAFKYHDSEEMKKYDQISNDLKKTNERLSGIEAVVTPMQQEMVKNNKARETFNTWSIRISTAVFIVGVIGGALMFTLDLWNKSNAAMAYVQTNQNRSYDEKLDYYRQINRDLEKSKDTVKGE